MGCIEKLKAILSEIESPLSYTVEIESPHHVTIRVPVKIGTASFDLDCRSLDAKMGSRIKEWYRLLE